MLEKCVLTILELNWNQNLRHKTKVNICHHMLTSSTQLQNRSFHVVERTRTSSKCQKNEKCTWKACKNTVFLLSNMQICRVLVAVAVVVGVCKTRNLPGTCRNYPEPNRNLMVKHQVEEHESLVKMDLGCIN